jgi:multiple sugar transport system permease protein
MSSGGWSGLGRAPEGDTDPRGRRPPVASAGSSPSQGYPEAEQEQEESQREATLGVFGTDRLSEPVSLAGSGGVYGAKGRGSSLMSRWWGGKVGRRQPFAGWLLLSPALLLYLAFIGIPLVGIFVISFLQWDLVSAPHFVGLQNFRAVAHDSQLGRTLLNSFLFDVMTTSVHIVLGLGLALGVTAVRSRAVRYWTRTAIVAPFLMSAGVVGLMWSYYLAGETGPFNYYLRRIGLNPPNWLASSFWSLPGLVIIDVWATLGFTFIIFLVGLQGIPAELHEAASIDGAGTFDRFRRITLPLLSPATFLASVTAFIGAFEIFTWPLIDTNGGPGIATQTIVLYIYKDAFQNYQFGYSAVLSLINVLLLVSFLVVMALIAKRWVHYERV